jgi:hypothetical protein
MELIKNFPGVKHVLKQIIFMVKTLKLLHLLLQLFDKLCLEVQEDLRAHPLHKDSMGHRILHCVACQHNQGGMHSVARQNFECRTRH